MIAVTMAACARPAEDAGENVAAAPAPAVPLVPHETLLTLVPDLSGWTRSGATSAGVGLPAPATHAVASYTRGQARIDLELTDTGGHPDYVGAVAKVAGTSFIQKASNGYMKGTTIAGHPATESWNHVDRIGDISVLVDRRFVVHATGTALDDVEVLRTLIERVDLATLDAKRPRLDAKRPRGSF